MAENDEILDIQRALDSQQYDKYTQACAELQKINIESMANAKRVAFFLNIYQCMYVHYFLLKVKDEDISNKDELPGVISIQQIVFNSQPKSLYYNLGGYNLTLDQIKNGLLRQNKQSPFKESKSLTSSDERLKLLQGFQDPRILFVCLDYPECLEQIDSFEGLTYESLYEELD